jgi:hypothetical protein
LSVIIPTIEYKKAARFSHFLKSPAVRAYHPTGWKRDKENWNLFTRIDDPTWIVSNHPDPWPIPAANPTKN